MQQCTATVVGTMKIVSTTTRTMQRLVQRIDSTPVLSRQARMRQALFDWHHMHGRNVSRTCRHFGISRPTFYRWQRRYVAGRPQTLEDRACVPRARRQPSWTAEQARAVRDLREQYPRWGKAKLQCCLARGDTPVTLSVSMVGRILRRLRTSGQLLEPPNRVRPARRCWTRPYGIRKPSDYAVCAPGDLIQVDSGSEFMAEFEAACQTRAIRLFVLPPRSPKLNGCVERTNRTWRDEFYACKPAAAPGRTQGAA